MTLEEATVGLLLEAHKAGLIWFPCCNTRAKWLLDLHSSEVARLVNYLRDNLPELTPGSVSSGDGECER